MNETVITLQGNVGTDVAVRQAGDARVATFRVACTPRRFNRKTGEWGDGDTQWYTVNAWRGLADNVEQSVRRGDPVVVHGRLNAQTWTNSAGMEVTTFEIDAQVVGHDLCRGTSTFTRPHRGGEPGGADEPGGAAADAASGEETSAAAA